MGIYTWGQLRMQLEQSVPGVTLDKIDASLTTRYARVLDHTRWSWLEQTAYVETQAPYQSTTDTVNVTQGSNAIVGTGTTWSSGLNGLKFNVEANGPLYTFTFVDATHATLDRVYEGSSNTAAAYSLLQNIYPLPSDFKRCLDVSSADDGEPLDDLSELEMDQSVGFRNVIGTPEVYAITPSSEALDGGTSWQIEFFPVPRLAKGYPVRYERSGNAFNGSNTGSAPLPFVSDGVLLAGGKADLWGELAAQRESAALAEIAKGYEAKFGDELTTMVRANLRQSAATSLKPAKRYTRHRLARLVRNSFPRIRG